MRFSGNTQGAGILVVTGNLTVVGNVRFDGLVVVLGDLEAGAGTAQIYGAVVMGPNAGQLRGTGLPSPLWLTHSVSVPSGQNRPHQTRPRVSVASMTPGHQTPQNMNWANRRRLSHRCAPCGGSDT